MVTVPQNAYDSSHVIPFGNGPAKRIVGSPGRLASLSN
jgi:hypothetical protein